MTTLDAPLIDVHAMVRRHLRADANVLAFTDSVHARHLPKGKDVPAIIVAVLSVTEVTSGVGLAWTYLVQVECQAASHIEAGQMASAVTGSLLKLSGAQPEGVVLDCAPRGVTVLDGDEFTPVRPNHIVTVEITGRALYGGV